MHIQRPCLGADRSARKLAQTWRRTDGGKRVSTMHIAHTEARPEQKSGYATNLHRAHSYVSVLSWTHAPRLTLVSVLITEVTAT